MSFSVLMSVYKNDDPAFFRQAMDSVLQQTLPPDEIVLVRDGPVPEELQAAVDSYIQDNERFCYIPLEQNGGLGNALNIGLEAAKHELVARMDTDDICELTRFERQMAYMQAHPDTAVCGGQILEFIDDPAAPVGKREVPLEQEGIGQYMKTRNPVNHVTVLFRKSEVLKAGSYIEISRVEDYYLWCRMYLNGAKFVNLDEVLVRVRIGEDMYRRRGGFDYFQSWYTLEKFKHENGMTSTLRFWRTVALRFVLHVLLPNRLRGWLLRKTRRK